MSEFRQKTAPTYRVTIFVAGDIGTAKMICQRFCFSEGLCVTLRPTDFIYTGGTESGMEIGLINYPRFPVDSEEIRSTAMRLAQKLVEDLSQWSASIVCPDTTIWLTRRDEHQID